MNLVTQILYSLWLLGVGGTDGVSVESNSTMNVDSAEHQPMVVTDQSVAEAIETLQGNRTVTAERMRALALLKQAADIGNGIAAKAVGDAYIYGYSTEIDYTEGLRWYRLAGELGNADGWHAKAWMIGGGWVKGREKAESAEYYLRAHAMGNRYSKRQFAHRIIQGAIPEFSPEYGLQLYHELLDEGHYSILANLRHIYREGTELLAPNPQKLEEMEKLREELIRRFRVEGRQAITKAIATYQRFGIDAAVEQLTQLAEPYKDDSFAGHYFNTPIWNQAFRQFGREDPEFAVGVFGWLRDSYDHYQTHTTRIRARITLARAQIATGRIALLSQNARELEAILLSVYGINVREQLTAAQQASGAYQYPAFATEKEFNAAQPNQRRVTVGSVFDIELTHALNTIATEFSLNGKVHEALLLTQWLDQIGAHRDAFPTGLPRVEVPETVGAARNRMAAIYSLLGEYDKAAAIYGQSVANQWGAYRGRQWHMAATEFHKLFAQGKVSHRPTIDLDALEALRADNNADEKQGRYEVQLVRLIETTNTEEARWMERFVALISYAMDENMPFLAQQIRMAIIHIGVEQGLDNPELEPIFLEALLSAREMGAKIQEPFLYRDYARFLASQGRMDEALELMRTARDLFSMWDFRLRQLEAELYLSEFLFRLKRIDNEQLLAVSQSEAFEEAPQWLQRQAMQLSAISAAIPHESDSQGVVLSPERITTAPVSEWGAQAIFTLTNPGPVPINGKLHFTGVYAAQSYSEGLVLIEASAGGDETRRAELAQEWSLGPWEQGFIMVATDLAGDNSYQVELSAQASGGTTPSVSILEVQPGSYGEIRSFISAHLVRDNPYFASPVFHILQGTDTGEESIAIRLVASAPCRIEAYDENGELLFVDASGDGRLDGRGDLLPRDSIGDGVARVHLNKGETAKLIEIRYFPQERNSDEPIEIRIERLVSGEWKTQAMDIIELLTRP